MKELVFPFMQKKPQQEAPKAYVPVGLVQRFASQGMPEQEIINRLKQQGFAPGQIDAAMRAVLKEKITGQQNKEQFPSMQMPGYVAGPEQAPQRRPPEQIQMPSREITPPSEPEPTKFTFEEPERESALEQVTLEEIIEGVVAEKWGEFEERMSNFEERDLQLQDQLQDVRNQMKELEKIVNSKEQNMAGRFEDLGGSMSEIQGRIGSIERVFKEFLPELSKNVKIISDIAEKK